MSLTVLIIDSRPAYLRSSRRSLLQMPVGLGSLLEHLGESVRRLGDCELAVLPDFDVDEAYGAFVAQTAGSLECRVFDAAMLTEHLAGCEPSDWLMIVDPEVHPLDDLPLRQVKDVAQRGRHITHLLAAAPSPPVAHDRLLTDANGNVRRIQRYYAGATHVQRHGVVCSMMPAAVLHAIDDEPLHSLSTLRETLVRQGLPTQDISLSGGVIDLSSESGLLQCMEWHIAQRPGRKNGQSLQSGNGHEQVDPRANTYGPVVVEDGATIEQDAIVIGPAVIGAGSRVSAGSVVVHGLVGPGITIPPGITVHRRVVVSAPSVSPAPGEDETANFDGAPGARTTLGRVLRLADPGRRSPWYPSIKRALDCMVAGLSLILLLPLFLIVAILVKLTSKGPAFFAHQREGLDGEEFRCWKFRTMVSNAHALQRKLYKTNQVDGPQFKMDRDPRITRIGHWLRLTNIDELPQLYNVLRGEMSLIGPRPSPFRENQICVPWRQARLSVRPGITGLWQVCRHERAAGDFHQWIHYDMLYVRHMSPLLDMKIVLFTFLTLAGRWNVPLRWLVPSDPAMRVLREGVPASVPILDTSETTRPGANMASTAL